MNKDARCLRRNKGLSLKQDKNDDDDDDEYLSQGKREKTAIEQELIFRKINSITKTCSKPCFNTILKKLTAYTKENADTICQYIIAEETEFNIKSNKKNQYLAMFLISK